MVDKFEVGKRYRWIGEVEDTPILTLVSIPLHDAKVMASGRPILCTYVERDCSNPFVSFEGMDDKRGRAFREYYEYFEEVEEEKEKEMEQDVTQFEVGRSYRYIGEDAGKKVGAKRFESIGINPDDAKIIASGKPLKVTKIERSGVKFEECKRKWHFSSLWYLFREVNAQMAYTEAQAEWVRDNNVKAGDSVKLLRAWTRLENGYNGLDGVGAQYDSDKRELHPIGGVFRIVSINDECLCLASNEFDYEAKCGNYFPYFVLEKIAPPKEAEKSTPSTIGVTEFITGKWYVCHATERPDMFHSGGKMDGLLDGKPHLCTNGCGTLASFDVAPRGKGMYSDMWAFNSTIHLFEEVPAPHADVDWEKKYTELKAKAIAMLSALSDASGDFKEEIESL